MFEITLTFRCVVWTGDGRVFFYNPSLRQSVWEVPEDLQGRDDVTKLMQGPPDENAAKGKYFLVLY